jgi:PAS domain S-box-containing protein
LNQIKHQQNYLIKSHGYPGVKFDIFRENIILVSKLQQNKMINDNTLYSDSAFYLMAEASDILIATSDITSNATYFNKKWSVLTGRSISDLLQYGWLDLIHAEDRSKFLELYLSAFEKKESWKGEFRIMASDGSYHVLLASGSPIHEDGTFIGYISSSVDITDRVAAIANTADSNQTLLSMVLHAPIGICLLDAETLVSEIVNDSFLEVAGKSYEEIFGKHYWEPFAEAKEYYADALDRVVADGVPFYANEVALMLIRHGKEETIYVTFVYSPLFDLNGNVNKVVVWVLENTMQVNERQRVEHLIELRTQDLAELNEQLKESNANLAQFAHVTSHDLQEPLRKIAMFASRLQEFMHDPYDRNTTYFLNKIQESASRMQRLIIDILSYSELTKEPQFVSVDLNEILKDVEIDLELVFKEREAVLNHKKLPVVEGIPIQLRQLFYNVINNSLKFARKDIPPVINISNSICKFPDFDSPILNKNLKYHKIQISDNGIGIDPLYTQTIFEIFNRLHDKSDYSGTGIGLAMCKKIVLNHHGDITAGNSSKKGAVFNIYLPCEL